MYYDDPITLELIEEYNDIELKQKLYKKYNKNNKVQREHDPEKVKAKYNKRKNEKAKKRNKIDLKFNLSNRISRAMRGCLKGSNKAGRHWETLVNYTLNDLTKRLKSTMPKGHTWQDFLNGKLHIDHIIPQSTFNYTKPEDEDFQKCWALGNLQLLTREENLKKSNKII